MAPKLCMWSEEVGHASYRDSSDFLFADKVTRINVVNCLLLNVTSYASTDLFDQASLLKHIYIQQHANGQVIDHITPFTPQEVIRLLKLYIGILV